MKKDITLTEDEQTIIRHCFLFRKTTITERLENPYWTEDAEALAEERNKINLLLERFYDL